jgi:hypothetical protein
VLAGELGESRDGSRRREAEIALERKAQRAASGSEFRLPAAEVAETEGQMAVRVQLRGEPGGVAVGCEDLDDGFEVDRAFLLVEGGALSAGPESRCRFEPDSIRRCRYAGSRSIC